jgi:hypothetical protein
MPNLSESEPFLSADQETLLEPLINLNRRLEFSSTKASESSNQMLYMTFKNFDFFKEVLKPYEPALLVYRVPMSWLRSTKTTSALRLLCLRITI